MAQSALTEESFLDELRRAVEKAGGASAFAIRAGVSRQMVASVLSGDTPPSAKIARALGYRRVLAFVPTARGSEGRPAPEAPRVSTVEGAQANSRGA